ncbi:MAG TPA: nuclear transport factor 2 family protein [Acidimicrobiales bacterium]|nr:nuclear transport factor 2 family protein [Acidimicrobiales bacterium]
MALLKRKRAGLGDAMDVVTRFVNACNRHDADGVYSCLHPDFDSIQPMYPSRNFRGADQVRRNWQAIFDAEPGFRLTVLRSAAADDTVWLELHGAGEDAEVAGVFVMGIQGDRIRWARIYSALVEPVPAGVGEPPAPAANLREVRAYEEPGPAPAAEGEVVEEALIAPVLDMERSGRRRRRRRGGGDEAADAGATQTSGLDEGAATTGLEEGAATTESEPERQPEDDTVVVVAGEAEVTTVVEAGAAGESDAVVLDAGPEADVAVVIDADAAAVVATDAETDVVVVTGEAAEPAPEVLAATPADDDGGPPTEAVDMVTVTTGEPEPADEPAAEPATSPPGQDPPRRLFGRKRH